MKHMHYFSWEIMDIPYVYMWLYVSVLNKNADLKQTWLEN